MNKDKLTRAGFEPANIGLLAQLAERRHVNPEVAGSNPALVNLTKNKYDVK